ncbi:MAG: PASTA domain-containing protein [Bacteroidales bacterium]|nr:PASTA domain-containing protein [Bacteroidales bacterium]
MFLDSIKFGVKHLVIAAIVVSMLVFATLQVLKYATHHGESISVPELIGMNPSEAEQALSDLDLSYCIIDSVHEKHFSPGEIVEQTPKAGTSVKGGRVIYLTIQAFKPLERTVGVVCNQSYREVLARLESCGFDVEVIEVPSEYSSLVLDVRYQGKSLKESPDAKLPEGSHLVLEVGKVADGSEIVTMPHLTGLLSQTAQTLIRESSLVVGRIDYDETPVGNDDSYYVYWQSKHAGSSVAVGSRVDIKLSRDPNKKSTTTTSNDDEEEFY